MFGYVEAYLEVLSFLLHHALEMRTPLYHPSATVANDSPTVAQLWVALVEHQ